MTVLGLVIPHRFHRALGPAIGAPLVAWLIQSLSWRWSFIITGALGFVWVAIWLAVVSSPEKTKWLPEA